MLDDHQANAYRRKTAVVTGGTDGIGKQIALALAKHGIRALLVGRDARKGARAEADLRSIAQVPWVDFLEADLSLLHETERLGNEIRSEIQKLDYLVLCAGVVVGRHTMTSEGIETNFAVNYLSRFVLVNALLPVLQAACSPEASSRILVISGAARGGKIHYNDIHLSRNFGIFTVVPQFCAANDLFVIEQARRLARLYFQPVPTITALKVGAVRTNIRASFPTWMKILVPLIVDPLLSQTPQQIAASALRLLLQPEFEGVTGELFTHIKNFKRSAPGKRTASAEEGKRLWDLSEQLVDRVQLFGSVTEQ